MAMIKCPECSKSISDKAPSCIHCGYPLLNEDAVSAIPVDIDNQSETVHCIQLESKSSTATGKLNAITGLINKINPAVRILCFVVLVIASLVCLAQGKNALNNDSYEFYKEHYEECMEGYDDCKASAKNAGYLFKATYESLADSYEEMANDDLAKINGYRTKAVIFYVSFAILLLIAVIFIYGVDIKKAVSRATEAMKNRTDSVIPPMIDNTVDESNDEEIFSENIISDEPTQDVEPSGNETQSMNDTTTDDMIGEPDLYLDKETNIEANSVEELKQGHTDVTKYKKPIIIVGIVIAVLIMLSLGTNVFEKKYCTVADCNREIDDDEDYCYLHRCGYSGCSNEAINIGQYCYSHTCKVSGCKEKITTSYDNGSCDYCSKHQKAYDSAVSTSHLIVSDKSVTHNSSYTIFTATMTNDSAATYKFVTVKGSFTDKSGTVCDTDSTYAVGSEGLAPGESTTFRMSIPKDRNVTSCTVSITDYDIDSVNASLIDFD